MKVRITGTFHIINEDGAGVDLTNVIGDIEAQLTLVVLDDDMSIVNPQIELTEDTD